MTEPAVAHHFATSGGVRLHYVESGSGPVVVLLHGIPESWLAWDRHIGALAGAGHRVVAPDLRGYNLSDRPREVGAYRGARLAEDVATIIRATGAEAANVVGHSWGALAAWLFATRHPRMLKRLVIMDVPHPLRWVEALRTWSFWRRNPQMLLLQIPVVPESVLRARDHALLRLGLERDLGRVCDRDRIEGYVQSMGRPGGLTGALNYYRAFLRENPLRLGWALEVIEGPVLVIWGGRDRYFPAALSAPPPRWVRDARVEIIPGAGHWAHRDEPEAVRRLLLDFLGGG